MAGRPSLYTRELSDRILGLLETGRSLRSICAEDWARPIGTVLGWIADNEDGIAERYAHARDRCVMAWAEETIEIADDARNDFMLRENGDVALDREHIQRSVARISARQWMAARLLPKVFGDKSTLDLNAKIDVKAIPDDRLELRLAELIGQARIGGSVGRAPAEDGEAEASDVLP